MSWQAKQLSNSCFLFGKIIQVIAQSHFSTPQGGHDAVTREAMLKIKRQRRHEIGKIF